MAWIESHQSIRQHPKLIDFAAALEIEPVHACGHLHFLWYSVLDYAQDGDVTRFSAPVVAGWAGWTGDPQMFFDALEGTGWLDTDGNGSVTVHDWWDYAGRLLERRAHQAAMKSRARELHDNRDLVASIRERDGNSCRYCGVEVNWKDRRGRNGGTYDHVVPGGDNTLENIVVACRSCNSAKGQRTPEEAGMGLDLADSGRFRSEIFRKPNSTTTNPPTTPPTNQPKTHKTRGRASGASQSVSRGVEKNWKCLNKLKVSEMRDPGQLAVRLERAVGEGRWGNSEKDRRDWFALACRAVRLGKNPPAMFRKLAQECPDCYEAADEDAAGLLLRGVSPMKQRGPVYNPGT